MKGKAGETRRMMFAFLFTVLVLAGVFGAFYAVVKVFTTLGHEEWLTAGLHGALAIASLLTSIVSWKRLSRYRPEDRIPASVRARLKDNRSSREKFVSSLFAYSATLLVFGIAVGLFFIAFPKVAAQAAGDKAQFLFMSAALALMSGYILYDWFRTMARYVTDDEPANRAEENRPPGRVKRAATFIGGLALLSVSITLLVMGCLYLTKVWNDPELGTFAVMLALCGLLGFGFIYGCTAVSILKGLWRPTKSTQTPASDTNSEAAHAAVGD